MLIAGGYLLLSEPARSAAEYAQWRQAKTMTLGEKSLIILLLKYSLHSDSGRAVCFNLRSDVTIAIPTEMNGLGRTLSHTDTAALAKSRVDLGTVLVINERHPIRAGSHTGETHRAMGRIDH